MSDVSEIIVGFAIIIFALFCIALYIFAWWFVLSLFATSPWWSALGAFFLVALTKVQVEP